MLFLRAAKRLIPKQRWQFMASEYGFRHVPHRVCVCERQCRRTGGHQMSTDCFHLPGAWSLIPPLCLIKHTHTLTYTHTHTHPHTGATRSSLCQPYNSAVYPSGLDPKYFLFRNQIKKEMSANTCCDCSAKLRE